LMRQRLLNNTYSTNFFHVDMTWGFAKQDWAPLVSSSRSKFRPMKTRRFMRGSPGFQGRTAPSSEVDMVMSICTPWKTCLASESRMWATPLDLKRSTPLRSSSRLSQLFSAVRSSSPSNEIPTLPTLLSCWCSPSVSRNSSSISRMRPGPGSRQPGTE